MTEQEYDALSEKMKNDTEFLAKVKTCKTEHQIYDTYKEAGYTDVGFEEFSTAFKDLSKILSVINEVKEEKEGTSQNTATELSDEQLDSVIGGFDLFKFFVGITDFIPFVGPLVSDSIKAVKAFASGNIKEGLEDLASGVAVSALSSATGGLWGGKGLTSFVGKAAGKALGHFAAKEEGGIGNLIDAFES